MLRWPVSDNMGGFLRFIHDGAIHAHDNEFHGILGTLTADIKS